MALIVNQVVIPCGKNSEYRFIERNISAHKMVDIEQASRGFLGEGHHYLRFEGKGLKAISLLMERTKQLEQFFEAMCKLSITSMRDGSLEAFIEREDVDDEFYDAYELVAQMIEEHEKDQPRETDSGVWVRDDDDADIG